jgi:hypothetical protein
VIDPRDFRELVIRPALEAIGLWSPAAEELLMDTAAVESRGGRFLRQVGAGPALGPFQMEPATHDDLWDNFLRFRPELRERVLRLLFPRGRVPTTILDPSVEGGEPNWRPEAERLAWDLRYAAAMARLVYRRRPEPLPRTDDVAGMATYWKRWYNTEGGKGDVAGFVAAYERFVRGR